MSASEIRLYEILKNKFNDKEAETFMEALEETVQKKIEQGKTNLATKEDIQQVRTEIQQSKVDLIKWVFAFWLTIVLMIVGLYLKK